MRIGKYEVVERVGEGATGVVYRAEGDVAVKVLRNTDPVVAKRFVREARLAATIESRHLVRILDVGDGFFVMPYYPRGSLAEAVPLRVDELVRVAAEIAQALDALHGAGIVHRDVKPSNVLLGDDGAVLADFGLARGVDSTQLTHDGQLIGTTHYLAPELIEGSVAAPASDIYAFACLLYEAATGTPPFAGRNEAEIGYAHLVEQPPRPNLPGELPDALLLGLAKDPRDRPTSATALHRMLRAASRPSPA
ncbi:MAG TPA: serine/threonine-protein kinase [Gaiellaceae bacterium]|nr:serine/threonine-protein kinase [Gaiellaceae bacterium]